MNKKVTAELRHGQALAMQWVAFVLQLIEKEADGGGDLVKQLLGTTQSVSGTNGIATIRTGCLWTIPFLLGLAVELSLKAILIKEYGHHDNKHDLAELYEEIPEGVQEKLESEFAKHLEVVRNDNEKPLYALLKLHRKDFENWRYLDGDTKGLKEANISMQLAVTALLDVYNREYEA